MEPIYTSNGWLNPLGTHPIKPIQTSGGFIVIEVIGSNLTIINQYKSHKTSPFLMFPVGFPIKHGDFPWVYHPKIRNPYNGILSS